MFGEVYTTVAGLERGSEMMADDTWMYMFNDHSGINFCELENNEYIKLLNASVNDDLNTPTILANLNRLLRDGSISTLDKFVIAVEYDKILGLKLVDNSRYYIFNFTSNQEELMEERNTARINKDYKASDILRGELEKQGIEVLDRKDETKYFRK